MAEVQNIILTGGPLPSDSSVFFFDCIDLFVPHFLFNIVSIRYSFNAVKSLIFGSSTSNLNKGTLRPY